jgi:hypothetical protein
MITAPARWPTRYLRCLAVVEAGKAMKGNCLLSGRGRCLLTIGAVLLSHLGVACGQAPHSIEGREGAGGSGSPGPDATTDPGSKSMHRLNTAEYNATVTDVLGTTLEPATGNWRGGELAGFDNMASVLGVDELQYDRYFGAAKTLAAEVVASESLRARWITCDLGQPACVRAAIEAAGLRLFRRPLAADETATYQRVYDAAIGLGDDPLSAFELTLQALLSSAEFIYRIELDPHPLSSEPHPLGAFELASRLSYFLWSSAPDAALLAAAADGSLTQPAVLSTTVDRLLDDPRSARFVANFAGQWLGARQVVSHAVAPELHQWTVPVARAAADEILRYFSEFLQNDRSWLEFPHADINFVDPWLAPFYQMPLDVYETQRVEYGSDQRAGFFGLAGFLALSSFDRRTSPSLRGRWISSNMLCRKPPEPPANVPSLEATGAVSQLDVRKRLEQHRQNPECAGCHALFDAYGLALEQFDAIGQYRAFYEDGTPIDVSVELPAPPTQPDGLTFVGLAGLSDAVASDPDFGTCLAKKLLTYGLGRPVGDGDEPSLAKAQQAWLATGNTPSVRRLIHALVLTEAFRYRRGENEKEAAP